ncbi:ABC transporter substrate-binding protein [Telmatospirillum sp. J64-1]|uniref:ABC transporter substrate-binding protein n=1 Tax=Telmatospirillum sp. J64-1 TaxID=2502183 RepID=UPI00115D160D|nr:ABC transporter substrate-binding protein [Telmatospirillum sp. J64-1]
MRGLKKVLLSAVAFAALGGVAQAAPAEKVKIGLVTTLTGPSAVLGQQIRDGFLLSVQQNGGKIGGIEAEVIVVDDEQKPDVAVNRVRGLIERDKVDFVVGPVFSNIAVAMFKPVVQSETFFISPNSGTSNFAGRDCSPYYFVTSYQNDQMHGVLGKHAQNEGLKRVVLMVPNYQAGKDSVAGFKRHYEGEIVDEIYTSLGQLDFSAELARIAALQPDALFTFMPGGMGVNLTKQFRQAGLADKVKFLSAFTVDETTLPAQRDDAVGFFGGANWAPDFDNEQSKAFVAAYEAAFDNVPGTYAMQAFDAAQLLDSAVRGVGGDLSDKDAVRAALMKADFPSLRGEFTFNHNGYPIQDFYLVKAAKREDGKYQTEIVEKIFDDYADDYAGQCRLGS